MAIMPEFCPDCESMMLPENGGWTCVTCGNQTGDMTGGGTDLIEKRSLEALPKTDSGSVKKEDAVKWLESLDPPTKTELLDSIVAKPSGHSGSTFATPISNIRLTGGPEFIETWAAVLKPFLEKESVKTRLEVNLQQIENRETGELTNNFALYLSVAERG